MRSLSRPAAALAALVLASPCWAGQVKLEIRGGLVTLSAKDASVREILAEWSRVGQTRIVNAERVPGGLVNLELSGVPEARALDIVLRTVAGYVAAPRVAAGTTTGSLYDRIMIMPIPRPAAGGASPVPTTTVSTPPPFEPRGRPGYQPQPSLMVDDQDEPVVQPQTQPTVQPMMGGTPGAAQPGMQTPLPQGTSLPPGQQQGNPGSARPGMTTPGATVPGATVPKPPGAPGGPGGM